MIGEHPRRSLDLPPGDFDFHHTHHGAAVFAAHRREMLVNAEIVRRFLAHERRVVPRDFRERLRQFLQPAVVGETAIEQRRARAEVDLVLAEPTAGMVGSARFVPSLTVSFATGADAVPSTRPFRTDSCQKTSNDPVFFCVVNQPPGGLDHFKRVAGAARYAGVFVFGQNRREDFNSQTSRRAEEQSAAVESWQCHRVRECHPTFRDSLLPERCHSHSTLVSSTCVPR